MLVWLGYIYLIDKCFCTFEAFKHTLFKIVHSIAHWKPFLLSLIVLHRVCVWFGAVGLLLVVVLAPCLRLELSPLILVYIALLWLNCPLIINRGLYPMEYHQNKTIHNFHNNVIYTYLAFNKMPPKYKNMPFHYFFLLVCSKHISKYNSGLFSASDLMCISGYSIEFVRTWSGSLINKVTNWRINKK